VDNTTNLFQIAKVDPLIVLAAVPEDDLPALQDLKSQMQNFFGWTVHTVGAQPISGFVDDIGYLIDPNQHTAVVRGHIPNPNGLLRAGQFVTATVDLLPPENVVEVPISAIVEDGRDSIVFVQADPKKSIYTMRRVQVTNRFDRTAYMRSIPVTKDEEHAPGEDGQPSPPTEPLLEGERVLTTGAMELKAALANKLSDGNGGKDGPGCDVDACVVPVVFQESPTDSRQFLRSLSQEPLPAATQPLLEASLAYRAILRVTDHWHGLSATASGTRVHAAIGGRQPLDSGHGPAEYQPRAAGHDLQRGSPDHGILSRGG
jgi:hypothetical protein